LLHFRQNAHACLVGERVAAHSSVAAVNASLRTRATSPATDTSSGRDAPRPPGRITATS